LLSASYSGAATSRGHLLIDKLERMALDACARLSIETGSFCN